MSTINLRDNEVSCKIVYYGPSLSGKTTNICALHAHAPDHSKSELRCVDTHGDRTLFFDHFALDLGQVGNLRIRFQVFGVPGQTYYRVTRKMVLSGVDGVVFVADSISDRMGDNLESLDDMRNLLTEHGYDHLSVPIVMQYNKRDLPDARDLAEMERMLNPRGLPAFEAIATQGKGVIETFKAVCKGVVTALNGEPGQARRTPAGVQR